MCSEFHAARTCETTGAAETVLSKGVLESFEEGKEDSACTATNAESARGVTKLAADPAVTAAQATASWLWRTLRAYDIFDRCESIQQSSLNPC